MKISSYALVIGGLVCIGCASNSGDTTASSSPAASSPAASTGDASPSGTSAAGGTANYAAVQQIFTARCMCHLNAQPKAGISLASYEGVMKGGEEGPVVKAGDPNGSVLAQALKGENGKKKMPPKGDLSADEMKTITDWIQSGAKNG